MKKLLFALGLMTGVGGLVVAQPSEAQAAKIYTNISINMWAGPSMDFPRVLRLPAGAPVAVYGCLNGYNWCDVGWRGQRGWVDARYLYGRHAGNRVYVNRYGPQFGFNLVNFNVGNYWDRYYRNDRYSWYRDRDRYIRRYAPPPPPPRHHAKPGPSRPHIDRPGPPNRPAAHRPGPNRPEAHRPGPNRPEAHRPGPNRPDGRPGHNRSNHGPGPDRR